MKTHAVTGAFGYSGKYIAQQLLDRDCEVITLTNSPNKPHPFGNKIKTFPLSFDNKGLLIDNLKNVDVLYNTYWVRFDHKRFTHSVAVENTLKLFEAAKESGVKRIVHVSITNPDENSPLPYFNGKAKLENALINSGISYSILRPTVLFGNEDILVNNISWMIRKFPFFGIFGKGDYKLQPIYVDDLAKIAVEQGISSENNIINAIGPETYTYKEMIKMIMGQLNIHKPIISMNPTIGLMAGKLLNLFLNDVVITEEEIKGLMSNLLYVESPPTGSTSFAGWVKEHKNTLGKTYANELKRRR